MRATAGDSIRVASAGTAPGETVNPLSAQSLAETGVDITAARPRPATAELLADADVVVTPGAPRPASIRRWSPLPRSWRRPPGLNGESRP